MSKDIETTKQDTLLLEQYANFMRNIPAEFIEKYSEWEKQGDNYKQYSLYDTSLYETSTSSSITNK